MKKLELKITGELAGKEIKSLLYNELRLSSRMVTKLKTGDAILLNGKKENVRKTVNEGDTLTITIFDEASQNIVPNNIPLDIIYEDEDILVLNKPYNMPTHPSFRHFENTLANGVMHYFRDTKFTFRAVNRLDRDTTGLVLVAKNRYAANILSEQLKNKEIEKTYLLICTGKLEKTEGVIEAPIEREKESVIKRIVSPNGKYARTEYTVLAHSDNYSLVLARPKTGRTHQIRVHFSYIGHPLFADFIYGEEIPDERTRLHCCSLKFSHPTTKKEVEFRAPCPDDFFIKP